MKPQTEPQTQQQVDFQVRPLSHAMAAEVTGLDLSQPLDDFSREAIYDAFLSYQILVFRDQQLSKQQQIDFSQQFGTLERHTLRNQGADTFPLVHVVSNLDADGKPRGSMNSTQWHTDKSFRPQPSMATILHAITLPPTGGDTCFADMYSAYETLPETEKAELDNMRVVHSWELSRENIGRPMSEEEKRDAPNTSHPLVRTHPDTGRKCLFIGTHAAYLEGLPMAAGRKRIEQLEEHATDERFIYRHQWRPGDVLMWDNRCLLHRADQNFDAARYPRVLNRTCLRGTATQ